MTSLGSVLPLPVWRYQGSPQPAITWRPKVPADWTRVRQRETALREHAGDLLPRESVGRCHKHAARLPGGDPMVSVRRGQSGAHFGHVITCGDVHKCPTCARRILSGRADDIEEAVAAHLSLGGVVYLLTLTVRHHKRQSCRLLRKSVMKAWGRVKGQRAWVRQRDLAGWVGDIRRIEVTNGDNGWHPHLHLLVFLKHDDEARAAEFGRWLYGAWEAAAARELGDDATSRGAFDWTKARSPKQAGAYIIKAGIAAEMTDAGAKRGRQGNRNQWELLADSLDWDDGEARALWLEYAEAFKGTRLLEWSNGLRKTLRLVAEETDLDLSREEPEPSVTLGFIDEYGFNIIVRRRLQETVLTLAERDGWDGMVSRMEVLGVPKSCFRPPP